MIGDSEKQFFAASKRADEAREAWRTAHAEYRKKRDKPIIGFWYARPAWRRHCRAWNAYQSAFHEFLAVTKRHGAAITLAMIVARRKAEAAEVAEIGSLTWH